MLLMRRDPKWSASTLIFVDNPHSDGLLANEGSKKKPIKGCYTHRCAFNVVACHDSTVLNEEAGCFQIFYSVERRIAVAISDIDIATLKCMSVIGLEIDGC
jgi:hypothetical protein